MVDEITAQDVQRALQGITAEDCQELATWLTLVSRFTEERIEQGDVKSHIVNLLSKRAVEVHEQEAEKRKISAPRSGTFDEFGGTFDEETRIWSAPPVREWDEAALLVQNLKAQGASKSLIKAAEKNLKYLREKDRDPIN